MSPATVVNFHGSWNDLTDAYRSKDLGGNGWAQLWPNNNLYQSYQQGSKGVPVYFPNLNSGGHAFGAPNFFCHQVPSDHSFSVNLSHQKGSHYVNAGFEY